MSRDRGRSSGRRDRGATPVVGKALEVAVVVLLAALLATALFGGVVPTYRSAAGAELADRTLARSAAAVERAAPADPDAYVAYTGSERVDLPDQIRGAGYVVAADGERLRLDHPRAGVGGSIRPALPNRTRVEGSWRSDEPTRLRVRATERAQLERYADDAATTLADAPAAEGEGPLLARALASRGDFRDARPALRNRTTGALPGSVRVRLETPRGGLGPPRPPGVPVGRATVTTVHGPVRVAVWYG